MNDRIGVALVGGVLLVLGALAATAGGMALDAREHWQCWDWCSDHGADDSYLLHDGWVGDFDPANPGGWPGLGDADTCACR